MKKSLTLLIATLTLSGMGFAEDSSQIGVVNFSHCVTESKIGKNEQAGMEKLKKQMESLIEDSGKKLQEVAEKLQDSDYLDGLSPEGEQELKTKYAMLREEIERYQGQYQMVMQQANMRVMQNLSQAIQTASQEVAKELKLAMVASKDAFFFSADNLDVTNKVVAYLDKKYDENKAEQESENEAAE